MRKSELINDIFGGRDRLDRLHVHFQRILSSENQIQIAIISFNYSNIITLALKRVGLLQYFANLNIIGSDTSIWLKQKKNKLHNIIEFANVYKLNLATQVLFIDDNVKNIECTRKHCLTYHVFSEYTLNGLSMAHMKEIEELVGVYVADLYDIQPPSNKLSSSIKLIDSSTYQAIKNEVGGVANASVPIDSLPVIQFIQSNWNDDIYQHHFLYFAKLLKVIRMFAAKVRFWSNANVLPMLLELVQDDAEIIRRYGQSLAALYHSQEAETAFQTAIKLSTISKHRLAYGYFLFKSKRYIDAHDEFWYVINSHKRNWKEESTTYVAYAETLKYMSQPNKAEQYYKLAIEVANNKHDNDGLQYNRYGNFLYIQGRYKESLDQFNLAVNGNERYANNHYGISKPLYQLGMFTEYEYHLKRALELDPSFYEVKQALNQYYLDQTLLIDEKTSEFICSATYDSFSTNVEEKKENVSEIMSQNVIKSVYNVEFDTFWFDVINTQTNQFDKYYDNFVENNMNDIRCLLFADEIESQLETKIGIDSVQNMQLMMQNIHSLRTNHQEFVNELKQCKLYKYYPIFAHKAIYTTQSLMRNIKCEQDIKKLLQHYNHDNDQETKQFDVNDNNFTNALLKFVNVYN
eukprot:230991_1